MAETHGTDSFLSAMTRVWEALLSIVFPHTGYGRKIRSMSDVEFSSMFHIEDVLGTVALFSYKNELIRHMVWLLKYKGDRRAAKLFAGALNDYLLEELSDTILFNGGQSVVVIPLPLSKKRERERGFNQMKLVCDELQKLGRYTFDTKTLLKTRHTKAQTTLKRKDERRKNVEGAFEARGTDRLKGARVILIDDVITTGSTMNEAKRTLKEAGIKNVLCIALTH
ncbi:ComF family protein [Candidatus Kaiserbacteria bacterium]|nr:ComF family protein [Candidatus Kaiserbacteria bacterium]